MPIGKLTYAAALAMQPGDVLKCDRVTGLELRGKKSGRVWFYYHRVSGEQRRPKLGTFPTLQIDDAREVARDMAKKVARGDDPSADKIAARRAPTVSDLCDKYLELHARLKKKARSIAEDERNIKLHVRPLLGSERVVNVNTATINTALLKIAERAPIGANRVRALLGKMFAVAERDVLKWRPRGSNPVRGDDIVRTPERKRKRYASVAELRRLGAALDAASPSYPAPVAAIYCLAFTAARVTELCKARRSQRFGATLVLSEHKTDAGDDDRVIRLPTQALEIMDAVPDDGSGLVFGANLDRNAVFRVWVKVRSAAGCLDLRIHDLRRTFASLARTRGASLDNIGELLGHAPGSTQTTGGYAYLFEDEANRLTQDTADAIEAALLPAPRKAETDEPWSG